MAQETVRRKVYYMYFWRNHRRERSPEYPSLVEFTKACGVWCDNHPDDYTLQSRIVTEVVSK